MGLYLEAAFKQLSETQVRGGVKHIAETIEVVGALRSCALDLPGLPLGLQSVVIFPGFMNNPG